MFKKIFEKVKSKAVAIKTTLTTAMITAMTMPVFAGGIQANPNLDPTAIISNIADYVLKILTGIGLVFIVWGGFQFGMAMKDEDAASKSKAILVLVSGIIMVGLRAVLVSLEIITG